LLLQYLLLVQLILTSCTLSLLSTVSFAEALSSPSSLPPASLSLSSSSRSSDAFVLLGGTGRIGTAVALHLLYRQPTARIVLVGRNAKAGTKAVAEVLQESSKAATTANVSFVQVQDVWNASCTILKDCIESADCVIHTAGPYANRTPTPMRMSIAAAACRAYVDVADPLPYLETAILQTNKAAAAGTTVLVAAGAFPGMSNVLAVQAASQLPAGRVQDVRFQYFTKGLGGSGPLNLFITNLGFGEPMAQFDAGALRFFPALSGLLLGQVDFFLPSQTITKRTEGFGNEAARERVGRQTVFSWPFPEAATVPTTLRARGESMAAMGTAPSVWNDTLGLLVRLIPRAWWRNAMFSQALADFSEPLVQATDGWLRFTDKSNTGGETHAMRVDVTQRDGGPRGNGTTTVSIVQAHDSFRRCVAQSCAEFALDCMEYPAPGVWLPEQRFAENAARARIIQRLTSTPGTFCYTGPVEVQSAAPPTDLARVLREVKAAESYAP